jgi:hypothetical protein
MENCIILHHLFTGDCFIMYPCICYYAEKYKNIYIFCLERNETFIKQLYSKMNVIITVIPQKEHDKCNLPYAAPLSYINKYLPTIKDYNLVKTGNSFSENGKIIPEWEEMNRNKIGEFWRKFYFQANIPYSIRDRYKSINRNHERELDFYKKITSIYGKEYIFVHDHRNINYTHKARSVYINKNIINENEHIPVFHPSVNFYNDHTENKFYMLWDKDLITNNILDFCMILEKATQINIIDSSFVHLCTYLDLSKVKEKKIVKPNWRATMVDLDNSFSTWIQY